MCRYDTLIIDHLFLFTGNNSVNKHCATLKHTHTHPRVKVRVTGERTGGGTSSQSWTELMSRGAGLTEGKRTEIFHISIEEPQTSLRESVVWI